MQVADSHIRESQSKALESYIQPSSSLDVYYRDIVKQTASEPAGDLYVSLFERLEERVSKHEGRRATRHIYPLAPPQDRFERLAEKWEQESAHMASPIEMAMLPSYQQIIGIGWQAVPLILEKLQEKPDHWFWALQAITGASPVSEESQGVLDLMAESWIQWGKYYEIID